MKEYKAEILIGSAVLLALAFLFFFARDAHAETGTLIASYDFSQTQTAYCGYNPPGVPSSFARLGFTGVNASSVSSVVFRITDIQNWDPGDQLLVLMQDTAGVEMARGSSTIATSSDQFVEVFINDFTYNYSGAPITATGTFKFYVQAGFYGTDWQFKVQGGPDTLGGVFADCGGSLGDMTPVYDPYMLVYGEPVNAGAFLAPRSGRPTYDFSQFRISYTTPTSTIIGVQYGKLGTDYPYYDQFPATISPGSGNLTIPKSVNLENLVIVSGEIWEARILFTQGNTSSTQNPILFSVYRSGETLPISIPPPTATSSIGDASINCELGNIFANGFCHALVFLFVPGADDIEQFSNVGNLVKSKPPIGYFASIASEIQDAPNEMPTFQLDADIGSLLPFQLLYDPLRWIAGLAFVVYMYHRIKNLLL
jgi:hypothetical protein